MAKEQSLPLDEIVPSIVDAVVVVPEVADWVPTYEMTYWEPQPAQNDWNLSTTVAGVADAAADATGEALPRGDDSAINPPRSTDGTDGMLQWAPAAPTTIAAPAIQSEASAANEVALPTLLKN